jgi:hypothetical protein
MNFWRRVALHVVVFTNQYCLFVSFNVYVFSFLAWFCTYKVTVNTRCVMFMTACAIDNVLWETTSANKKKTQKVRVTLSSSRSSPLEFGIVCEIAPCVSLR